MVAELGRNESAGASRVRRRWVWIAASAGLLCGLLLPLLLNAGHYLGYAKRWMYSPTSATLFDAVEEVSPYVPKVALYEVVDPGLDFPRFSEVKVNYWLYLHGAEGDERAAIAFLANWLETPRYSDFEHPVVFCLYEMSGDLVYQRPGPKSCEDGVGPGFGARPTR